MSRRDGGGTNRAWNWVPNGSQIPPFQRVLGVLIDAQKLVDEITTLKQKSFSQLGECLGKFIPNHYLRPTETGALSRRRFFSKENTFWAFFSQVLDADGGCQEVVRKLQAFASMKSKPLPSSSTAA